MEEQRHSGTIKYYNAEKGYGFVKDGKTQKDYFFHITKVNLADRENIVVKQEITYRLVERAKGEMAIDIQISNK